MARRPPSSQGKRALVDRWHHIRTRARAARALLGPLGPRFARCIRNGLVGAVLGRVGDEPADDGHPIEPLFPINNRRHPSLGRASRAGHSVTSVDGDGTMRRCHFIKTPIGNIYDPDFATILRERPCTNATCGCHIGYVHLDDLKLYDVFGDGILERISTQPTWRRRTLPVLACENTL
jgi:hypothetical protein